MLMRWLSRQAEAALDGLQQLLRTPLATLVTCTVIGIALAMPAALRVALDNAATLEDHLKESATLTVFLKEKAGLPETRQVVRALENRHDVLAIQTISPTHGLQQLEQLTGMDAPTSALPENPLPWVIVVTPASSNNPAQTLTHLKALIEQLPETDSVQLDTDWLKQLGAILNTIHRIAFTLMSGLGIAVLFITGNTIWTVVRRHSREIHIIRLTGGTARFIRRPFLYAGALYGLLGGLLAWLLVTLLMHSLREPVQRLAALYKNSFALENLSPTDVLTLLASGALLGFTGAWLAVTRYLASPQAVRMASTERKVLE